MTPNQAQDIIDDAEAMIAEMIAVKDKYEAEGNLLSSADADAYIRQIVEDLYERELPEARLVVERHENAEGDDYRAMVSSIGGSRV